MTSLYAILAIIITFAAIGFMLRRLDRAQFEKELLKKEADDKNAIDIVNAAIDRPIAVSDAAKRLRAGNKRQKVGMPRS